MDLDICILPIKTKGFHMKGAHVVCDSVMSGFMQTECAAFGPPSRHGNLSPCQQRNRGRGSRRRCHHLSGSHVLTTIAVIEIIEIMLGCLVFLIFPHLLFDHVIPSFRASINFG